MARNLVRLMLSGLNRFCKACSAIYLTVDSCTMPGRTGLPGKCPLNPAKDGGKRKTHVTVGEPFSSCSTRITSLHEGMLSSMDFMSINFP